MDFTKAIIPEDCYMQYTNVNVGSSSAPEDCTNYGLILLKTTNVITAHIRCRPGTWVICQTSNIGNWINCYVYTDYNDWHDIYFTFNIGEQAMEHWYIGGKNALCTFAYSRGTFGANMGSIKAYSR